MQQIAYQKLFQNQIEHPKWMSFNETRHYHCVIKGHDNLNAHLNLLEQNALGVMSLTTLLNIVISWSRNEKKEQSHD